MKQYLRVIEMIYDYIKRDDYVKFKRNFMTKYITVFTLLIELSLHYGFTYNLVV